MPTVTIRKKANANAIEVVRDVVVVRSNEKLTFDVSNENGWQAGTKVTVTFHKEYRAHPLGNRRKSEHCGPFRKLANSAYNPEEGKFEFTAATEFETGEVQNIPKKFFPRRWKYDVTWTGLPNLDPIVKIEKGG